MNSDIANLAIRIKVKKRTWFVLLDSLRSGSRYIKQKKKFAIVCMGIIHRLTGVFFAIYIEKICIPVAREVSDAKIAVTLSDISIDMVSLAKNAPDDSIEMKYSKSASIGWKNLVMAYSSLTFFLEITVIPPSET